MTAGPTLVVGLGITGGAVAAALCRRGVEVVAVDDQATPAVRATAAAAGVELYAAPSAEQLALLVNTAAAVVPTPGLPHDHPALALAAQAGATVVSELDLAGAWDDRPLVAVTGTDGKTTVTTLVTAMLEASGRRAATAGNTDVPLVAAIDDPGPELFVVEASSFRLAHTRHFRPMVATWLNFGPDHQDVHPSLASYEAAKARIWADQRDDDLAVGNADDPVVASHLAAAPARQVTFGMSGADATVAGDRLVGPGGEDLGSTSELWRAFPHDVANALAAAATALAGGATIAGVRHALAAFPGLHHRLELVGEAGGVRFYDDSKATAPHATVAALRSFPSAVLIAGGRNKGLDLDELATAADRVRAVVAIGEAALDVERAFAGRCPVVLADSMDEAVGKAAAAAHPGDAVVLSPGCASFDRYTSYAERGDDFTRAVREHVAGAPA